VEALEPGAAVDQQAAVDALNLGTSDDGTGDSGAR